MARPQTTRRIHQRLKGQVFKPLRQPMSGLERIRLSLDGLEALRLADLEGLYHEEAAQRMGVSRATFSRVLTTARAALANALVNGKELQIDGGKVEPHSDDHWPCPVHEGDRRRGRGCRCSAEVHHERTAKGQ